MFCAVPTAVTKGSLTAFAEKQCVPSADFRLRHNNMLNNMVIQLM